MKERRRKSSLLGGQEHIWSDRRGSKRGRGDISTRCERRRRRTTREKEREGFAVYSNDGCPCRATSCQV
ncbi:hypothetical protein CSUI_006835, partial [Cystoisospora suis]